MTTWQTTSKCDGNQSLRRQPLHLGNDRFELCIVFTVETRVVFGQHVLEK
jgi:hypothetical protein